jgi:hypothetical protein
MYLQQLLAKNPTLIPAAPVNSPAQPVLNLQ